MSDRSSEDVFYKVCCGPALHVFARRAILPPNLALRDTPPSALQVYIGNIDFEVSQKAVEDLVRKHGEVADVLLKTGVLSIRLSRRYSCRQMTTSQTLSSRPHVVSLCAPDRTRRLRREQPRFEPPRREHLTLTWLAAIQRR